MFKLIVTIALLAAAGAVPAADNNGGSLKKPPRGKIVRLPVVAYATRDDAMAFADDLAARRDLDPAWVRRAIGDAKFLPIVARLMQPAPAGTPKNWRVYRSRFIDPVRIGAGVKFWQANREALQRAEKEYGVSAEIIVGIIGVETIYGQQVGSFRVIDALSTLAFNFPESHPRAAERSAYFRSELEHFLSTQKRLGADPLEPVGSFAGAMGLPQFMPSSWEKWAVDFDGDSKVDLAGSAADAIGSVANYFRGYGWQTGMPAYYPVSFDSTRLDKEALLAPDILPTFSVASFTAKGAVLPPEAQQHKGPLALVELQNGGDEPSYVAGTENFYVITRYNWSSYYAMAVIELGREVKAAVERGTP
jgi:membrane-bound lytic murein transglycosylase B